MSRTLFIDDGDLVGSEHVERVVHPGAKSGEPVLRAERPWEEMLLCGGTVRREGERFRMWYQSYGRRTYTHLYAESSDGIRWERPSLGLFPDFDGGLDNNIFLSRLGLRSPEQGPIAANQDHNPNVLHTPHQGRARQYTLISYEYGRSGYVPYDGYVLAYSADGLLWSDGPREPVIPGHADVGWFLYDERERVFRGMVKNFLNVRGFRRRALFYTESEDGLDWLLPRPPFIPDEEDDAWAQKEGEHAQFYGMPIARYEDLFLGFLQVFRVTDAKNPNHDGPVDVQLACSRDGRSWERVGGRRTLVERGAAGTWDAGGVYSGNALVHCGDEVRLYYTGTSTTHGVPGQAAIGAASWPQDRMVGLWAGPDGGTVELRAQVAGQTLHLNAAVQGRLEVGFAGTEFGAQVAGDGLDHCVAVPERLRRKPVRMRLHLRDAELFSLWWS